MLYNTIHCPRVKIPGDTIEELFHNYSSKNIVHAMAKHPCTPESIMKKLMEVYRNKNFFYVDYCLSDNPGTTSNIMELMGNRMNIFKIPSNPKQYLKHMGNETRDIFINMAHHPNTPTNMIESLIDYQHSWISSAIAVRPNLPENLLRKIVITQQRKSEQDLIDLQEAKNLATPISTLEKFIKRWQWGTITLALAKNPSSPDSILSQLGDSEWVCVHPNTSTETLERIITRISVSFIKNLALQHPHVSRITKQRSFPPY